LFALGERCDGLDEDGGVRSAGVDDEGVLVGVTGRVRRAAALDISFRNVRSMGGGTR
jgi:hypothetical protein